MSDNAISLLLNDFNALSIGVLQVLRESSANERSNAIEIGEIQLNIAHKCGMKRLLDIEKGKRKLFQDTTRRGLENCVAKTFAKQDSLNEAFWITPEGEQHIDGIPPVIPPPSAAILQISDFHFGWEMHVYGQAAYKEQEKYETYRAESNSNAKKLAVQIKTALDNFWPLKINAVAACGDFCGTEEDYSVQFGLAEEFLDTLGNNLKLDNKQSFIVIPGNHDINWNLKTADDFHAFKEMNRKLKESKGLTFDLSDNGISSLSFENCQTKVLMLGLSSVQKEKKVTPGFGYVGDKALEEAKNIFFSGEPDWRIALVHHHVLPVEIEVETLMRWEKNLRKVPKGRSGPKDVLAGFSEMADAGRLLKHAIEDKYDMILHGHMHKFFSALYQGYSDMRRRWHSLAVIGAPSLGAQSKYLPPGLSNGFNLILLYDQPRHIKIVCFERKAYGDVTDPFLISFEREIYFH